MPPRRLPTLGALRAFEAAARHLSFKRAAEELAVTPTSISHQVRSLEEQLGARLFDRLNRRVALTETYTHYFPVCTPALAERLAGPADLAGQLLVHEASTAAWRTWLEAAGAAQTVDWRGGPVFHDSALAIESAIAGDGIALGDELLAGDHLLAGRLVKPFSPTLGMLDALYAVRPEPTPDDERVDRFLTWLVAALDDFAPAMRTLAQPRPFRAIA